MVCSNVAKSPLGEDNGQNCDGKGKFTSLVAGKGSKGQNRDGKGKPKCKGQNEGKAKFTSLLGDHTPSAPPVNTFRSSLDVDVERFTNAAQVLPRFLLPFGKARDRERKKLVASQQAQKKELELKHLNALKTFDERYLYQEGKLEVEMKREALLQGLIGLRVRKAFKGHGVFSGEIQSLRRDSNDVPLWLVKYEDGDDEEVYEEELEQMRSAERKAEAAAVASSAVSTPRLGSPVT